MKLKAGLITVLIFSFSCAHKRVQQIDVSKIDKKEKGIFFGKLIINYDKKLASGECDVYFKQENKYFSSPISNDGSFKSAAPEGEVSLKKVTCGKHDFVFKDRAITFENSVNGDSTWVGEFHIKWKTAGFNPWVTVGAALVGWVAVMHEGDQLEIKDRFSRTPASTKSEKIQSSYMVIPYGFEKGEFVQRHNPLFSPNPRERKFDYSRAVSNLK